MLIPSTKDTVLTPETAAEVTLGPLEGLIRLVSFVAIAGAIRFPPPSADAPKEESALGADTENESAPETSNAPALPGLMAEPPGKAPGKPPKVRFGGYGIGFKVVEDTFQRSPCTSEDVPSVAVIVVQ